MILFWKGIDEICSVPSFFCFFFKFNQKLIRGFQPLMSFWFNVMPGNGHYKTHTHKQIGHAQVPLLVFYLIEPLIPSLFVDVNKNA